MKKIGFYLLYIAFYFWVNNMYSTENNNNNPPQLQLSLETFGDNDEKKTNQTEEVLVVVSLPTKKYKALTECYIFIYNQKEFFPRDLKNLIMQYIGREFHIHKKSLCPLQCMKTLSQNRRCICKTCFKFFGCSVLLFLFISPYVLFRTKPGYPVPGI